VQSVERAFDLLEVLAAAGGELSLSEIAATTELPLPTIHRLLRTLVGRGHVRQLPSRRYALGPRLIHLGTSASAMLSDWAQPYLSELVDGLGETANLSMLDGDRATYVAQVPSRHTMRMFTEVGRRVHLHSTGVGKALLAQLDDERITDILRRTGMPANTSHTITDLAAMLAEIERIRADGYAVDDEEQEVGVNCVAVAVVGAPTPTAISVSGPTARMGPEMLRRAVPLLGRAALSLAADLQTVRPSA
jgi:IclR family transcriptional regulator, acetate operon repressor